jgi:serine/threonine protein phosphatase PrpC
MTVYSWSEQIEYAALTHRGIVRGQNEDAVAVGQKILVGSMDSPETGILNVQSRMLLLADGMGGHTRGELASREVLSALLERGPPDDILASRDAILFANDRLYDLMLRQPEVLGLGSTVVGVVFTAASVIYFNVGDSRCYRHRVGHLKLVSCDDVPVSAHSANFRRATQEITQSLGGRFSRTRVVPHVNSLSPLMPGESIVLCSDGLTDMVEDFCISKTLDESDGPASAVTRLMQSALDAGGRDNVSIVVATAR